MKDKQATVLFETTWKQTWEYLEESMRNWTFTFRVVGQSWLHDDGVRRIGHLAYEELTTDAMGEVIWVPTSDDKVPGRAMAELLIKAGLLPPDTDLSDIGV